MDLISGFDQNPMVKRMSLLVNFEILNLDTCSNLLGSSTVLGTIQLTGIKFEYNPSNVETTEFKKFL